MQLKGNDRVLLGFAAAELGHRLEAGSGLSKQRQVKQKQAQVRAMSCWCRVHRHLHRLQSGEKASQHAHKAQAPDTGSELAVSPFLPSPSSPYKHQLSREIRAVPNSRQGNQVMERGSDLPKVMQ